MSELREEILGVGINKKRIIGVILIALILISIFAFSVTFFSYLFGSQREFPSDNIDDFTFEDALLIKPPFPFDEDFWRDFFADHNITDIPPGVLDMLSEMLDGDIDDLDLEDFSNAQLAALFGALFAEVEVFRVFGYSSFNDMEDVLWKYEAFDYYNGSGWTSNAATDLYNFYSYGDYLSDYAPDPELLTIKMPIPAESGSNHLNIPTLFPIPFIIEDSLSGPNLNTGSEQLYKDEYNSTTMDLYFSTDGDVNITFDMFGLYNHLSTPDELNSTAVEASWTPSYIIDKYIQLPPTIEVYKTNNNFFNNHLTNLEGIINDDDNAFEVANKIRIYLQTQFSLPSSIEDYSPAPADRDIVDWFCETEQGVWSDFASAFCAFSRAFGVASRFVDGFNSYMTEEIFDDDLGQFGFPIKYKNLYNWAEIYIPTDVSGDGKWVQFDIFDSYGGGGNPIIGGDYNITVSTDQSSYLRPDIATITATVTSDTDPLDGLTITFEDYTTGQTLGQDITDATGIASIQVDINSTFTVGPHLIEASYDFLNPPGYNLTAVEGDVSIMLTDVNPGVINISDPQPHNINVAGYVYDPLNNNTVEGPQLNINMFEKGTATLVPSVFDPPAINTTTNGVFTDVLDVDYNDDGFFEVQANLDGIWWVDTPLGKYEYSILCSLFNVGYVLFTNSSNRMELNITKELDVLFYINGTDSTDPNTPLVNRTQTLNLTARAFSVISGPYPNREVFFYDYSRGNVLLGSAMTDSNGYASINYFIGNYCKAGPNLLYARLGVQENYSYFILNEVPIINIISGPSPQVINRSGAGTTEFNIVGEIYDSANNSLPISYSEITLIMRKGGLDYSSYLDPSEMYPYQTDSTGTFDLTFGVLDDTPPGNYTLRLDFNGTIDLSSYPYSYQFNLPILSTSSSFINKLKVDAEASFLFWINDTTSDNYDNPRINRDGDLNLTAYIHTAGNFSDYIRDGEQVEFYDVTQNILIGSDTTTDGYATVIYETNDTTTAGPHLIYAKWNNRENYSYFVLNDSININLDPWPRPRVLNKYDPTDYFIIQGYLNDTEDNPIKYGEISIHLFDDGAEIDAALRLISGSYESNQYGAIYAEVGIQSFVPTGNFTLEVWFNGTFIYSSPNNFNNEHDFSLTYINSTATTPDQLMVWDPNDIDIYLWIDGTPTLPTYYEGDGDHPEKYNRGAIINFTVFVNLTLGPADYDDVKIWDVFNSSYLLGIHTYDSFDGGYWNFTINTTSWNAGLHYIKVNWSSFAVFNYTYVIIDEKITIFPMISPDNTILRNVDSFSVSGTITDLGVPLRGLVLNVNLLDSTFTDVTGFYLIGSNTMTINDDGSFLFSNSISLSCPYGQYWLNVTFNGDIDYTGIAQTDFMVHNGSLIQINITARTYIVANYDTRVEKSGFYEGDDLYIYGTLYWDNGSVVANREVNVTIRDEFGNILATATQVTNPSGFFNISITIGLWDEDTTEVWANFYPADSFPFPENTFIIYTPVLVLRQS
ncbi:MAG: transglutaminase domain-containing protein [Promethearchaeota archaeon]